MWCLSHMSLSSFVFEVVIPVAQTLDVMYKGIYFTNVSMLHPHFKFQIEDWFTYTYNKEDMVVKVVRYMIVRFCQFLMIFYSVIN